MSRTSKNSNSKNSSNPSGPASYLLQVCSAILGAATSLYLAAQHTRLKSGIQDGPSFCSLGQGFDCDSVNASSWAEIGGVSLGYIGWLYFSFVVVALLLFTRGHKAHARVRGMLAWLAAIALVVDIALLGVQIFSIKNICLLCGLTYLANIGILGGLLWEMANAQSLIFKESFRTLFLQKRSARLGGNTLAFFAILYSAFAISGWMAIQPSTSSETAVTTSTPSEIETFEQLWKVALRKDVSIKATDAKKGNPKAPVKIVVFSDFECPHCKTAAFALRSAVDTDASRVMVAFKNFPLSSHCNPALDRPMHPNACMLAHLGYCANKKNKFWAFHDKVYFELSPEDIRGSENQLIEKLGAFFTKEEAKACLADSASRENTREDIQLGEKLELKGTPAIFINGKLFSLPITADNIRRAVNWELN